MNACGTCLICRAGSLIPPSGRVGVGDKVERVDPNALLSAGSPTSALGSMRSTFNQPILP